MKILFAASECVPFIKTGGLADVISSLPVALNRLDVDARVILPKYRLIDPYWKERMEHVCHFEVLFGWQSKFCGVERVLDNGVTYYFIDNEEFFGVESIYGDGQNEGFRFAFFCRAVLEALPRIGFFPDLLHCNDWQTGLIPALLRTQYLWSNDYRAVKTVFSIHNLQYQGIFNWKDMAGRLGIDGRYYSPDYLEFYGCISFMKGGLVFSEYVLTVSPTYAAEIKTPYFGERLDGLLRARYTTVSGILNGIDTTIFDPATDRFLPVHFTADNLAGKAENKALLQQECGLEPRPNVPLIGMIARLSTQKGFDLIERVLDDIMRCDVQMVLLGKGERRFVDLLNWANWRYPKRLHARIALDEGLAHRIYAASDLFLMPSQFEPCGLSQMIALRYGSVPIVRETGGLKDTIVPYNLYTDEGNGFSFANYDAREMFDTIERAVRYYFDDKPMWSRMQQRGMAEDFSWQRSARAYQALYEALLNPPKPAPPPAPEDAAGPISAPEPESAPEDAAEPISAPEPESAPEDAAGPISAPQPAPEDAVGPISAPQPAPEDAAGPISAPQPAPEDAVEPISSPQPAPARTTPAMEPAKAERSAGERRAGARTHATGQPAAVAPTKPTQKSSSSSAKPMQKGSSSHSKKSASKKPVKKK